MARRKKVVEVEDELQAEIETPPEEVIPEPEPEPEPIVYGLGEGSRPDWLK